MADELQIKMAQGAKPGEGGQLPGHKVDEWIGKVRHSTPGVGLISPPPHHDIYSIEDLAQLIFDLKNANRAARISVKLVSKAGVGTIAAGVAKAKSDVILISGHDGGTGASPLSSIRHAGLPWELGLAESHQTLVRNKLRSRVTLQTDGQLKTGRDVAIATLLGAEEWGLATTAVVVEGCILMRKCHLNTCPVGVATQDPELRKRFTGDADHVVNFFKFITRELREIMADLGFHTINEMVGQVDSLQVRENISHWKYSKLDLSPILYKDPASLYTGLHKQEEQEHGLSRRLRLEITRRRRTRTRTPAKSVRSFPYPQYRPYRRHHPVQRDFQTVQRRRPPRRYPPLQIHRYRRPKLRRLQHPRSDPRTRRRRQRLFRERPVRRPARRLPFAECGLHSGREQHHRQRRLFTGATSGEAFIRGKAGERFAVRNSGVKAVVEGVGDHGCEYMTGGRIVILGDTGRNFAAGMSGGIAYVYDVRNQFTRNCNREMVELDPVGPLKTSPQLKDMIQPTLRAYTASNVAKFVLDDFDNQLQHFVKVFPTDYKKALLEKTARPQRTTHK